MDLLFKTELNEESDRNLIYFLDMPILTKTFVFPDLNIKHTKFYQKGNKLLHKNLINTYRNHVLIQDTNSITILDENKKIFFNKPIIKIIRWRKEIVVFTDNTLFFVKKDIYHIDIKNILDISAYKNTLFILYSDKLEIVSETKKVYNLIDINPLRIECISDNKIIIVEKYNIFLINLETQFTKHIYHSKKLKNIKYVISSLNFYDINVSNPKKIMLSNTSKRISSHFGEEVIYILTKNSLIYINLTSFENKTIYFDNVYCKLTVNDNYVVLKFSTYVIIYDKFLKSYKKIDHFFDDFIAVRSGFAYIIDNFVYFTKNEEKIKFQENEIDNIKVNPFFVKDNFIKFKKDYEYDCSDSETWENDYGKLLTNKEFKKATIQQKNLKKLKFRSIGIKNNILHNKNCQIKKKKYGNKIKELLFDLEKYENYFEALESFNVKNKERKTLDKSIEVSESVLYNDLVKDYNEIFNRIDSELLPEENEEEEI